MFVIMSRALPAAAVFVCACGNARTTAEVTPMPPTPLLPRIVAHRGASQSAPENTLAAFRRAWDAGVEGVELDVHLSSDGIPMVIHDDDTERTTGRRGKVAAQSAAALAALDAGSWKSHAFAGEPIPTLAAALATIPDGRTMFVEIKTGPETAAAIATVVRASGKRGIALQGFDPVALAALARELPDAGAYWTVDPPTEPIADNKRRILPYPRSIVDDVRRHGFAGVALYYGALDDTVLAELRAASIEVDVWTINEPEPLAAWRARDVRWIETDVPERWR
jgi:glycerophosphoryl diester phosphodiesterase